MTPLGHELFREWKHQYHVLVHATTADCGDLSGKLRVECADGHQKLDFFFSMLMSHLATRNGDLRENLRKLNWRSEEALSLLTRELLDGWDPCLHTHSRHGPVLQLSGVRTAVHAVRRQDLDLLEEIVSGMLGKGLRDVDLVPHVPCLFAFQRDINMAEILLSAPKARERVMREYERQSRSEQAVVSIFPHFVHGNGQKRTYKLDLQNLERWKAERAPSWLRRNAKELVEEVAEHED